jgi:hypothetical protein
MMPWLTLVALIIVVFLGWNLYRRFGVDRIEALNEKRRATSRFVSRGELVDGNRHLDVSLALTDSTFFYENADMQASIDLDWVHEIEYDTRLATGAAVEGAKVLRMRSRSKTFEFILADALVSRWHMMLPARRAAATTVPPEVVAVPQIAGGR